MQFTSTESNFVFNADSNQFIRNILIPYYLK